MTQCGDYVAKEIITSVSLDYAAGSEVKLWKILATIPPGLTLETEVEKGSPDFHLLNLH